MFTGFYGYFLTQLLIFIMQPIAIKRECVVLSGDESRWRMSFPQGYGSLTKHCWVFLFVCFCFFLCSWSSVYPSMLLECWRFPHNLNDMKFNPNLYPQIAPFFLLIIFLLIVSGRDNHPCCFSVQIDFSSVHLLVWKRSGPQKVRLFRFSSAIRADDDKILASSSFPQFISSVNPRLHGISLLIYVSCLKLTLFFFLAQRNFSFFYT